MDRFDELQKAGTHRPWPQLPDARKGRQTFPAELANVGGHAAPAPTSSALCIF